MYESFSDQRAWRTYTSCQERTIKGRTRIDHNSVGETKMAIRPHPQGGAVMFWPDIFRVNLGSHGYKLSERLHVVWRIMLPPPASRPPQAKRLQESYSSYYPFAVVMPSTPMNEWAAATTRMIHRKMKRVVEGLPLTVLIFLSACKNLLG